MVKVSKQASSPDTIFKEISAHLISKSVITKTVIYMMFQ